MKRKILLILTILAFVSAVQAPSLGITPSEVQIEEISPGETESFEIYINPRNVDGAVQVTPSVGGPFSSTLYDNDEVNPEEVSDQGMEDWVNFEERSVVVSQGDSETYTLEDGTTVEATSRISTDISVPEDAEPGYHAAKIGFDVSDPGGGGFSTTNWVLPYINVLLKVPGNAERSVELESDNTRALRIGESRAQIIAMLHNTGTVTTEVDGGTVNILDENDQKVGELQLGSTKVAPGEFQEVSMEWENENLEPGTYTLDGTGDFMTGRFYIGSQVSIQQAINDRVEIEDPSGESTESESDVPIWLVMMILILLGIIMYSFDIDPLWIALIVGVLAITAFVLMTDLPLYLIGITLILGVVMIYYGVI
jgi:hypothetical protein